jgi:flagellin-like hook-associated protein FlgL
MTRINTNVSSLNAQKTLARSNVSLQQALTRLSTGLRINVGKDDPAGLIASEVLRSDIISVERAITNSQRANQMIATADSALGQVSALLNDVRGLVSEAANTGAMSDEQIAANQLQIDSSLEAIDRIAQVTQFQGKRLLDGSLDFVTDGVDNNLMNDLEIDQANFGTQDEIGVAVNVVTQATRAELTYQHGAIADDVVLEIGGRNGFEAFSFAGGSTIEDMAKAINLVADALGVTAEVQTEATEGTITASSFGADNDITITADTAGADEGNIRVKFTASRTGNDTLTASYSVASGNDPGTLDIQLETEKWRSATWTVNADLDNTADNAFRITANVTGAEYDGLTVVITDNGDAAEAVTYDHSSKTLTIDVDSGGTTDVAAIRALVTGDARLNSLFTITDILGSDGSGAVVAADNANVEVENSGVTGGTIQSLANDVIDEINATATLSGDVTAALATGSDGHALVTAFEEYAFYGAAEANNRLQFLAPEDTRNVRFVSTPGQALSVDLSTDPQVLGFSSAVVQGLDANTSFKITARQKGAEFDDIEIVINDVAAAAAVAVWSPEDKKLTINADIAVGGDSVADVIGFINNNDTVSKYFRADVWGTTTGTAVLTNANFVGTVATTSGGVTSQGTVIVNLETDADGVIQTTANDLISYFDDSNNAAMLGPLGISVANAEGSDGTGKLGATTADLTFATSGTDLQDSKASATIDVVNGMNAMFDVTAKIAGAAYEGVTVEFEDIGSEAITYDAIAKKLTISIDEGTTTTGDVVDMFTDPTNHAGASTTVLDAFTAALTLDVYGSGQNSDGTGLLVISDGGTLTGGTTDAGSTDGAALLGNADQTNTGLAFRAVEYGSDEFVSVRALNGTTFRVLDSEGASSNRAVGTDVDARINGIQAVGAGLRATINTSALDLSFSLNSSVTDGDTLNFSIVGGGAQFQLGPDVVSNQQARLGISSVNTAKLGGVTGRLFEVRSGGAKDLESDVIGAASVIEEVITQITTLRGRLGAFQRTTLETNIKALSDTLEALTEAESSIRDTDFAKESANLTRAQILVQSGLSVLTIANNNPQAVIALLR